MRSLPCVLIALGMMLACASSPGPPQPEINQEGQHRVWYTGPELRAELQYRWAARHPADEWLVVRLAVAGAGGGVVPVARDAISVETPTGQTLGLASQEEFRTVHQSLFIAIESYDAWQPYSHRFDHSLSPCGEWLFSPPPSLDFTHTVYPSRQRFCSGPLFFQVPGGAQPGRWHLVIELEESTARIPFEIEP